MIRRFTAYYKPHRQLFFWDMFCAFLVAVADLFYPMITKNIITTTFPTRMCACLSSGLLRCLRSIS